MCIQSSMNGIGEEMKGGRESIDKESCIHNCHHPEGWNQVNLLLWIQLLLDDVNGRRSLSVHGCVRKQSIKTSNIFSRFMQSSVIFFTLSKNWNNGLKAAHIFWKHPEIIKNSWEKRSKIQNISKRINIGHKHTHTGSTLISWYDWLLCLVEFF